MSHFPVPYILKVIMGAGHTGFQSKMFWGLISQLLRVKMPNVSFKHFTLQGEL